MQWLLTTSLYFVCWSSYSCPPEAMYVISKRSFNLKLNPCKTDLKFSGPISFFSALSIRLALRVFNTESSDMFRGAHHINHDNCDLYWCGRRG